MPELKWVGETGPISAFLNAGNSENSYSTLIHQEPLECDQLSRNSLGSAKASWFGSRVIKTLLVSLGSEMPWQGHLISFHFPTLIIAPNLPPFFSAHSSSGTLSMSPTLPFSNAFLLFSESLTCYTIVSWDSDILAFPPLNNNSFGFWHFGPTKLWWRVSPERTSCPFYTMWMEEVMVSV